MINPFNTPVETGIRTLVLLTKCAPDSLDINRLVLLDHGLLHSADFGGPQSLHPSLPLRSGELGVKRRDLELGLRVMIRAGLVEVIPQDDGIYYRASDGAGNFLALLEAEYAIELSERASWVVSTLGSLRTDTDLREYMTRTVGHWIVEFSQDILSPESADWR
jgi:hypothetical protein